MLHDYIEYIEYYNIDLWLCFVDFEEFGVGFAEDFILPVLEKFPFSHCGQFWSSSRGWGTKVGKVEQQFPSQSCPKDFVLSLKGMAPPGCCCCWP